MSRRFFALFALAWMACSLAGCFDCGTCIDHEVVLHVRSTTGGPVADVMVSGLPYDPTCTAGSTETLCVGSIYEGDVTIVVEAPGYEPASLVRSFPNPNGPNCTCDHRDLDEVVELTPL